MEGSRAATFALLETVRKLLQQGEEDDELAEASYPVVAQVVAVTEAEEAVTTLPSARRRGIQRPAVAGGPCANCGIGESPQWRRPSGKKIVLCNACGIYYSRHHTLPKRKKHTVNHVAPVPPSRIQAASVEQGPSSMPSSMDIASNDSPGEDEAVTATGPVHHMALLQQAACTAAANNATEYTRRPSSLSNLSQSGFASHSSRRSSPSRSSGDNIMLEDLHAPLNNPVPAIKTEAVHSQPVVVTSVPSRKRTLRTGSTSAPTTTPRASASDPTFATAAPLAAAAAAAPFQHPWARPNQHLTLLQQQQLLQLCLLQQQQHLCKPHQQGHSPSASHVINTLQLGQAAQMHPQALLPQQPGGPSASPAMQHALLLQHAQQQHSLTSLAHLSTLGSAYNAQPLGLPPSSVHTSGAPVYRAPQAAVPLFGGQSESHPPPLLSGHSAPLPGIMPASLHELLLPRVQAGSLSDAKQQQLLHRPTPSHLLKPTVVQQQDLRPQRSSPHPQQQQEGGGSMAVELCGQGGLCEWKGLAAAGMNHRLSPCSPHHQAVFGQEQIDAKAQLWELQEPAAKRRLRHGSFGGHAGNEAEVGRSSEAEAVKVIPTNVCRGPRSVSFDATSAAAMQQQQQLRVQGVSVTAVPYGSSELQTVYRPVSCALSDC